MTFDSSGKACVDCRDSEVWGHKVLLFHKIGGKKSTTLHPEEDGAERP